MRGKKLKRKIIVLGLGLIVAIYASTQMIGQWIKIGINSSDSIPGTVFLIVKGSKLKRNDMAAFYPPENPYYKTWFVKYVAGVPGDSVSSLGSSFYINGRFIGNAKDHAKDGSVLHPSAPGIITKDHYFVWTPHKDSYDSRYQDIGLVPVDRVIGRAIRIL